MVSDACVALGVVVVVVVVVVVAVVCLRACERACSAYLCVSLFVFVCRAGVNPRAVGLIFPNPEHKVGAEKRAALRFCIIPGGVAQGLNMGVLNVFIVIPQVFVLAMDVRSCVTL